MHFNAQPMFESKLNLQIKVKGNYSKKTWVFLESGDTEKLSSLKLKKLLGIAIQFLNQEQEVTYLDFLVNRLKREDKLKGGDVLSIQHSLFGEIFIFVVNKGNNTFSNIEQLRYFVLKALEKRDFEVQMLFSNSLKKYSLRLVEVLAGVMNTRTFLMPVFGKKQADQKAFQLERVFLLGKYSQKESQEFQKIWKDSLICSDGLNFSRELTSLPSNILSAKNYGQVIRKVSQQYGLKLKFYSSEELKKMGAGAFTAVDQAQLKSDGGIYELTYKPKTKTNAKSLKQVHLVGKGLCFDTGGYDIKTNEHMVTMKGDMQGSSLALSNIIAVSRLELPIELKAYLAVTENHISPLGYKADDVIIALNGMSIEVVNTDAEGRMVLADTLTLASQEKPHWIIDFATLTGAAVSAIGTKMAAIFTNQLEWNADLMAVGERSGERVWPFPLDEVYFKGLKSEVADTLQCVKGRSPDHILAACFLSQFVEKNIKWIHVDLTTAENSGGVGYADSLFTGWGVYFTTALLKKIIKK